MIRLSINKQIIIIAVLPALVVASILSTHYIWDQFDFISDSLNKNGTLIAKQLSPAAEYAVYSGNTELIEPLVATIIKNNPVLRIQILDKYYNNILDISSPEKFEEKNDSILKVLFSNKNTLIFSEPIITEHVEVDPGNNNLANRSSISNTTNEIGKVIITISTQHATEKKIEQIEHSTLITLALLLLTTLVTLRISSYITKPIKSLTHTVRNISAGDLDTQIDRNSTGDLGILESCINHMRIELKDSRTDMETQLNVYTEELQQTLEELEIRNAELDITRSKAIYANNAKSEFLANMSHEIRTPLSGIIGFTELLQDTKLSSQQKDYSSTIHKSSKHLLAIINDVLDLSKIEAGKTEIATSQFNLIDIIEDIINLLSTSALEKNIELFYRIEANVPTIIHSDPFRIHQIITNLIGNSIKFTDSGYVYLQVAKGELGNTENSIKFTVSDTGLGMSSTVKKRLFKAFTQADTSITRRFGGTGLGLVISRKLTMLMHGEIGFDSTEGEGSTFWFSVPIKGEISEKKNSELYGKNVAFISNHFIAQQTYKTLFNSWGCTVNNYSLDNMQNLAEIESENDIIVTFVSSKEINSITTTHIGEFSLTKPSLLVASTRSHSELRNLHQHLFNNAAFTSEKVEIIKQKLINSLDKETEESGIDTSNEVSDTSNNWSNINIMIVDDNDVNLRLAEIILHKHKARVTTAHSGAQAINFANLNSYDLIFMDLHMPGLDGYETTQKIRETTPGNQPVIIALTANAMPQEKEKVIQSGMNGILIKPVNDNIFQKVIEQWVLKEPINTSKSLEVNNNESAEIIENSIFSIELAKEFTGNNKELAYELFGMLRAELDNYRKAIISAADNNDLTELRNQVHKLHGASRCCGTTELKEVSSRIENFLMQNIKFDNEKEIPLLLNAIQNVAHFKINNEQAEDLP